jgi:hypothetical protein
MQYLSASLAVSDNGTPQGLYVFHRCRVHPVTFSRLYTGEAGNESWQFREAPEQSVGPGFL